MNPIESLWAFLKNEFRHRSCKSKQDLINAILSIRKHHGLLQKLFADTSRKPEKGMTERVEALYRAKGGNTKY